MRTTFLLCVTILLSLPGAFAQDANKETTVEQITLKEFKIMKLKFTSLDISEVCNRTFTDETDGDKQGGWTDQGGNDMRNFPTGKQKFLGVPFNIIRRGNSCIVLRGQKDESCPNSVTITVNRRAQGIYFMHASAWTKGDVLGTYTITYADNSTLDVPMENQKNICDWWAPLDHKDAAVGWRGINSKSNNIGMYIFPWKNPDPDREIQSITASTPGDSAYIMIAGITLTDSTPYLTYADEYYREGPDGGDEYRKRQFAEFTAFVKEEVAKHKKAAKKQKEKDSARDQAVQFKKDIKWPFFLEKKELPPPVCEPEFIAEDELGKIYRMEIRILDNLTTYGILFTPPSKGPHPVIIAQHGMLGRPEMTVGFHNYYNYNDMVRRLLRRDVAVCAPQLFSWADADLHPDTYRQEFDNRLRILDTNILAMDMFRLKRIIDYLCTREDIDSSRIGMVGLSYGGGSTLFTAAMDKRIKAALASCCLGNKYANGVVASLICPGPLWLEAGNRDEIFNIEESRNAAGSMRQIYKDKGADNVFNFTEFNGGHEFDINDAGIDFVIKHVKGAK